MAVSSSPETTTPTSSTLLRYAHRGRYLLDLFAVLVKRDMKLRYKRSVLGIFWTLLHPLAQLLVMGFLFNRVLKIAVPHYTSYLFCGLLAMIWFQAALTQATGIIVSNPVLIRRPGFPIVMLPAVTVMSHLIHFLLALPVLWFFLAQDGCHLSLAMLALPLVIGLQYMLILSLAYFTAALQVLFRDTQYLLGVVLQLLFYLTPVFYQVSAIPEAYQAAYQLNPMVHILTAYRTILIQGELPGNPLALLMLTLVVGVLLGLGYRHFKRMSYRFVEEV